jgi:hypothetical protein
VHDGHLTTVFADVGAVRDEARLVLLDEVGELLDRA